MELILFCFFCMKIYFEVRRALRSTFFVYCVLTELTCENMTGNLHPYILVSRMIAKRGFIDSDLTAKKIRKIAVDVAALKRQAVRDI